MGTIVIEVMPKSAQFDPMGRAVAVALASLGYEHFTGVRQGKRFVLATEGEVTDRRLEQARELAERVLLTTGVDEIVSVRAAGDATDLDDDVDELGPDWDDMPEYWGGVDSGPIAIGERAPRRRAAGHTRIDETMLGQVQSGSYYGRADDVKP